MRLRPAPRPAIGRALGRGRGAVPLAETRRPDGRRPITMIDVAGLNSASPPNPVPPSPVWAIAANVVEQRPFGPGGAGQRRGLKLFSGGAKVYVVDGFPGMGYDTVTVVGRPRKSSRFSIVHVRAEHLTRWRVELVYSPAAMARIAEVRDGGGGFSAYGVGDPGAPEFRDALAVAAARLAAHAGQQLDQRLAADPAGLPHRRHVRAGHWKRSAGTDGFPCGGETATRGCAAGLGRPAALVIPPSRLLHRLGYESGQRAKAADARMPGGIGDVGADLAVVLARRCPSDVGQDVQVLSMVCSRRTSASARSSPPEPAWPSAASS